MEVCETCIVKPTCTAECEQFKKEFNEVGKAWQMQESSFNNDLTNKDVDKMFVIQGVTEERIKNGIEAAKHLRLLPVHPIKMYAENAERTFKNLTVNKGRVSVLPNPYFQSILINDVRGAKSIIIMGVTEPRSTRCLDATIYILERFESNGYDLVFNFQTTEFADIGCRSRWIQNNKWAYHMMNKLAKREICINGKEIFDWIQDFTKEYYEQKPEEFDKDILFWQD